MYDWSGINDCRDGCRIRCTERRERRERHSKLSHSPSAPKIVCQRFQPCKVCPVVQTPVDPVPESVLKIDEIIARNVRDQGQSADTLGLNQPEESLLWICIMFFEHESRIER